MADAKATADPGDPYATHKANLRDTIKWLAGVFAALAAVVIAGAPVSGIGSLPWMGPRFIAATAALLIAFAALCAALVLTLRLLRSDVLYPSDLDPDAALPAGREGAEIAHLRNLIAAKGRDLFPPEYPSMRKLLDRIGALQAQAATVADDAALDAYSVAIDDLVGYQRRAVAFAVYQRFYARLRRSVPWLLGLGTVSLAALLAFGLATRTEPRGGTLPAVVVTLGPDQGVAGGRGTAVFPALRPVAFARNSAEVAQDAHAAIQEARDALADHPNAGLLLLAHTDTVASPKVNAPLARRRALAVRTALTERAGVAPGRVFIAELPESTLPIVTPDEVDEPRNRVVTMLLFLQPGR